MEFFIFSSMGKNLIADQFNLLAWTLDESMRRIVCAAEARVLGHGEVTTVSQATGVSRRAIHAGLKELAELPSREESSGGRIRRPGDGRKKVADRCQWEV